MFSAVLLCCSWEDLILLEIAAAVFLSTFLEGALKRVARIVGLIGIQNKRRTSWSSLDHVT